MNFLFYLFLIIFSGFVYKPDTKFSHYFLLNRDYNLEFLYYGVPGDFNNSMVLKIFKVKTGVRGQKPTPLPELLGHQFWLITAKSDSKFNPETAPYFLTLNIPTLDNPPYGPQPYLECNGQCNWELAGEFGLHGVNGENLKLSIQDPGSSGCVRHADMDIIYLYNILNPENEEIRYYID